MSKIHEWTERWAYENHITCYYKEQLPSTNDHAKNNSFSESEYIVLTNYQTQGRGRGSNTWKSSAPGTQLLSSWVYNLNSPPQPILSPLIGLALYKACKHTWSHLAWNIKAPNDLYIDKFKVGGVLLETLSFQNTFKVVIGLGLNVLNHPQLDCCQDFSHFLNNPLDENTWKSFLTILKGYLKTTLLKGTNPQLSDNDRQELLIALNLNPNLKKKYKDVLADGSLRLEDQLIPWSQL